MQFLYAHYLPQTVGGADSDLWDSAISRLDADNPVFDSEEFQNAIGLDDSISFQPASLMAVDDDSSDMFSESDPYVISMDQCSSSANDDIMPSKRLRARGGAFCTNRGDGGAPVNQNPFLAGLDAAERAVDVTNRRQCAYQYQTVCCEGPFFLPLRALDCHPCESSFHEIGPPFYPTPLISLSIKCPYRIIVNPFKSAGFFSSDGPNNDFF